MKIVLTTPTGNVGSRVVRLLLQAGVRPTLLLRDPEKLDDATRAAVDVVQGDQRDPDAVLRATEGADALHWIAPQTDDPDPGAAYARMGELAARAVREHGIARTVLQSSVAPRSARAPARSTGSAGRRSCSTRPARRCATCAAGSSSRTC